MTTAPTKFVVKVSSAKMPNSCKGRYQRIAVLEVVDGYDPPAIRLCRGVHRIVRTWERCHAGNGTGNTAAARAYAEAVALATQLNTPA